jgi:hypothetical protein
MNGDIYEVWAADAEVLAEIGRHVFVQATKVTVRLPKALAEQALESWQREDEDEPLASETPEQRAIRHKAATLGLIGLSIESESRSEQDDVLVELDAWYIGDACRAADDAGLLGDAPRSE